MIRLCLITALASLLLACGGIAPLFCDEDTPCTDPDRPFCDLEGIHPGSDGHARTCVPDPFANDAGPDSDGGLPACDSRIAFSNAHSGAERDVFFVEANGAELTNFTMQFGQAAFQPAWAPSGSAIAYVADVGANDVVVVSALDGGTPLSISNEPTDSQQPRWSLDGDRVLFSVEDSIVLGRNDIVIVDPDGLNKVTVPRGDSEDFETPRWSPDGSKIAFQSNDTQIYSVNADGTNRVNLSNSEDGCFNPEWSPDGQKILHVRSVSSNLEVFVMNADGSSPKNLTNNPAKDLSPIWSPDGSRFLFTSERTGSAEIFVANADGSGLFQLTDDGSGRAAGRAQWSPDGRLIAFERRGLSDDPNLLYVIDVETRGETTLSPDVVFFGGTPVWEPCP